MVLIRLLVGLLFHPTIFYRWQSNKAQSTNSLLLLHGTPRHMVGSTTQIGVHFSFRFVLFCGSWRFATASEIRRDRQAGRHDKRLTRQIDRLVRPTGASGRGLLCPRWYIRIKSLRDFVRRSGERKGFVYSTRK